MDNTILEEINEKLQLSQCNEAYHCFRCEMDSFMSTPFVYEGKFCECRHQHKVNCNFAVSFATQRGCFCPFHNYVKSNMKKKLIHHADEIISYLQSYAIDMV